MRKGEYTLITGGAGFVGSNLADALLSDGERVVLADNLSRDGVRTNAEWLLSRYPTRVRLEMVDIRDAEAVHKLVAGARQVFHLAAQVAVTTSLEDPASDLHTNLIGTFNVLEAIRARATPPPLLFTSTNKVYGGLDSVGVTRRGDAYEYSDGRVGIGEETPLDFYSPYGCSKGAADQYVHDYARIYGVPAVVFRMSCIYGTRQFGTEDQGWVAHFARSIIGEAPITIYGSGYQVRDILWVDDLVRAMRTAMARIEVTSGEVFNIGGGPTNAVSVRRVLDRLMEATGRTVPVHMAPGRPGDQKVYVSDTSKARRLLDWQPATSWQRGLEKLVEWLDSTSVPAGVDIAAADALLQEIAREAS
jgi:CDP-paratose 2-epimerase